MNPWKLPPSAAFFILLYSGCSTLPAPQPGEMAPGPFPAETASTGSLPHWKEDADPQRYEGPVIDLEEKYAPGRFPLKPVVFVGSSTFTKWTALEGLWPEYRVVNRGFGGSQMSDLVYYFDRLVASAAPRQVFVYEGDNDIDAGKPVDQVAAHFRQFGALMKSRLPGTPVVFLAVKPSGKRWAKADQYREFNLWLKDWAAGQGWDFLDTWTVMLAADGLPAAELYENDRLHLNSKGYARFIPLIKPKLSVP